MERPDVTATKVLVGGTGMVRLPGPTGGAIEAYIHDILEMFDRPGAPGGPWTVRAVSDWVAGYSHGARCVPVHSPIDRYPFPPYLSALAHGVGGFLTASAVTREVRRARPDVLHLNEELSIRLCRQVAVPKVLTLHSPSEYLLQLAQREGPAIDRGLTDGLLNTLLRHLDWTIVRDALAAYDRIVVLTSFAQEMLRRYGLDSTVIPLPVDTERYAPAPEPTDSAPRTILFVGRLERRKNPTVLVEALARLPSDVNLVFVGRGSLEVSVHTLAHRLGVGARVSVRSECTSDQLRELYRTARVFALPSRLEAFGRVVSEALSSGLPVVVARSRVYDDLTRAGVATAFGSVDECAEALGAVLDGEEERARRAARSREFAVARLSYSAVGRCLAEEYRRAIGA